MTNIQDLKQLIADLAHAQHERDRLVFDEENPHELGPPCTSAQLETLERVVGKPLPPSLLAFMQLHNGWDNFVGDAKVFSVEDHGSPWVLQRIEELGVLFFEVGADPFQEGLIPVVLGEDARGFLLLDPRKVGADGEMEFVSFDLAEEEDRFPDFTAYLRHKLDLLKQTIDDEVDGTADGEDD